MDLKQFFLRFATWWNGATLNTLFYTSRHGELVGHDQFGNAYYRRPGIDPSLGFERRWVIYNGVSEASMTPAGLERLAASHRRCPAERGGLQAPPLGAAAYRQPDRHAGGDPAQGVDAEPRARASRAPATTRPGARGPKPRLHSAALDRQIARMTSMFVTAARRWREACSRPA